VIGCGQLILVDLKFIPMSACDERYERTDGHTLPQHINPYVAMGGGYFTPDTHFSETA